MAKSVSRSLECLTDVQNLDCSSYTASTCNFLFGPKFGKENVIRT